MGDPRLPPAGRRSGPVVAGRRVPADRAVVRGDRVGRLGHGPRAGPRVRGRRPAGLHPGRGSVGGPAPAADDHGGGGPGPCRGGGGLGRPLCPRLRRGPRRPSPVAPALRAGGGLRRRGRLLLPRHVVAQADAGPAGATPFGERHPQRGPDRLAHRRPGGRGRAHRRLRCAVRVPRQRAELPGVSRHRRPDPGAGGPGGTGRVPQRAARRVRGGPLAGLAALGRRGRRGLPRGQRGRPGHRQRRGATRPGWPLGARRDRRGGRSRRGHWQRHRHARAAPAGRWSSGSSRSA